MTLTSLQALTWGTVTGAVLSALLLAASETGLPELNRLRRGDAAPRPASPSDPTAAARQHPMDAVPDGASKAVDRREPSGR